jgi:CHAD domain-containing protein
MAADADADADDAAGAAFVRRPWKHLQEAVEALGDAPADEALHEVRIRAKRARYAAEAVAPVVGKSATKFAKAVAGVQSVLGDLQDAVVAEDWLRSVAKRVPADQAVVAGQLVAVQHEVMAACRASFPKAWAATTDGKLTSWLH